MQHFVVLVTRGLNDDNLSTTSLELVEAPSGSIATSKAEALSLERGDPGEGIFWSAVARWGSIAARRLVVEYAWDTRQSCRGVVSELYERAGFCPVAGAA